MNCRQHNTLLCALLCVLFLARPNVSFTADIYVDDSATCGGLCDGTNWTLAYPDLQTALGLAVSGDKIYVAGGTYKPHSTDRDASFIIHSGVQVYGGYDGSGSPGARNSTSVLSGEIGLAGDLDNSYTIVYFVDSSQSTLLDGFTVTGGNADGLISHDHSNGGGIYITATSTNISEPTVKNCIISTNIASGNGGGLFVYGGGFGGTAKPQINGCTIVNNDASLGGGLFNDGNLCTAEPIIINCDFNGNDASSTGGAVYNFGKSGGSAGATVVNTLFRNNTAGSAGGYYSLASGSATSLSTITNCTFFANFANVGGAAYVNEEPGSTAQTTIANTIFWSSSAGFNPIFHYSGDGTPEIIISYSLVDAANCADIKQGTDVSCGAGMIYNQNPLFVNGSGGNFDLDENSPAINAGDNTTIGNTGVSVDIHSDNRIQVGMVDLGVDETPYGLMVPVELISFTVKAYNQDAAILNWSTASEQDNDYFTVEHSRNGIDYRPIDKIYGAGTTGQAQYYSYIDHQPVAGLNYYRLKQTDFDEQFSYSEVRTIIFENTQKEPSIYPNPVRETLYVNLVTQHPEEQLNFIIYDWAGKAVYQGQLISDFGIASISLESEYVLQKGMYLLRIEGIEQGFKFFKR